MIAREGHGIVIYLEQEGRGCGLQKKAAAYELAQTDKVDTVEAYRQLNLPSDTKEKLGYWTLDNSVDLHRRCSSTRWLPECRSSSLLSH
jgi:hypothetical protein